MPCLSLRTIEKLFVPSHLNRFQLAFTGLLGVVLEFGQSCDVIVQVGKPYIKRLDVRVFLGEENSNLFCITPRQIFRHECSSKQALGFRLQASIRACLNRKVHHCNAIQRKSGFFRFSYYLKANARSAADHILEPGTRSLKPAFSVLLKRNYDSTLELPQQLSPAW